MSIDRIHIRYSIDGGNTFVDNHVFENLLAGEYEIVVQDTAGLCAHQETVILEFGIIDNVNEIAAGQISIFPNPTSDLLTIEID